MSFVFHCAGIQHLSNNFDMVIQRDYSDEGTGASQAVPLSVQAGKIKHKLFRNNWILDIY